MKQPDGLIKVLLDHSAEHGDRDDAAMDLEQYKTIKSEAALIQAMIESGTDEGIIDSCKESLSQIMPQEISNDLDWSISPINFVNVYHNQLEARLVQLREL